VDRLEGEGLSVRAATDARAMQRVLPIDDFSARIRAGAMSALPAYLAFFCLENALRELIHERLTENYGAEWWDARSSAKLKEKVEDRRDKEGANRWHIARGEHAIYYTDFGDLKSLLQSNWTDFEDLFPDQNWVLSRITELEASRNVIAHSNTLDDRELSRIRLYLQDWIKQVG
jgi:hypothetical protein